MANAKAKMQKSSVPAIGEVFEPVSTDICPESELCRFQRLPRENANPRLLVFDPDPQDRDTILGLIPPDSYESVPVLSLSEVQATVSAGYGIDAVVMNLERPVESSLNLVSCMKVICPKVEVILVSRLADEELWIESIQRGAYDLLSKPLDKKEFLRVLSNALERCRSA